MFVRRPVLSLLVRLVVAATLAAGPAMPAAAQDKGSRRQALPEQRGQYFRQLPPEQRAPARDRMMERQRRFDDGGPRRDRHHHLSPEERVQLREQIREANREWRRGPGKGSGGDRR